MTYQIHVGDCIEAMRAMPDNSVDAIVTDPPYGLSFMGKKWDYDVPAVEVWAECLRVLKPGGHLLAFAGTRTQHRMACRIEDAGFEIREMIAWLHSQGFPKSRNIAEMDMTGADSERWKGWGTALKPALETVTFASKPYTDEQERDIILSNLIRLEARLWLLSSASAAEKNSTSNPSEYGAACGIAQWSAEETTSTRAALCDPMGMSLFELATTTSLNIVSSWRHTLAESWGDWNTSTTETKSSTTTDWKTLKFSLSQITAESIIKACSLPGGFSANAATAESHFNASLSLLQSIRTLSATERAMSQAQHEHQGAGVKPNLDPCIMARKPLVGTVAANVLQHGTGALNIDACRVPIDKDADASQLRTMSRSVRESGDGWGMSTVSGDTPSVVRPDGRWPANVIHDGSDEVVGVFPQASGAVAPVRGTEASAKTDNAYGEFAGRAPSDRRDGGGSAARFFKQVEPDTDRLSYLSHLVDIRMPLREFEVDELQRAGVSVEGYTPKRYGSRIIYCAKASRKDRNEGVGSSDTPAVGTGATMREREDADWPTRNGNHHPTVKPTDLMRYLVRLVTPSGGTVLDPFMGSGSTGKAAVLEGFRFIGCELSAEYSAIAKARIEHEVRKLAPATEAQRPGETLPLFESEAA